MINLGNNYISNLNPVTDLKSVQYIEAKSNNISDSVYWKIYSLPSIITLSQDDTSKIYTSNDLILTNCKLSYDKRSIILNNGLKAGDEIKVKICGGKADKILFILKPTEDYLRPANANVTYEKQ